MITQYYNLETSQITRSLYSLCSLKNLQAKDFHCVKHYLWHINLILISIMVEVGLVKLHGIQSECLICWYTTFAYDRMSVDCNMQGACEILFIFFLWEWVGFLKYLAYSKAKLKKKTKKHPISSQLNEKRRQGHDSHSPLQCPCNYKIMHKSTA